MLSRGSRQRVRLHNLQSFHKIKEQRWFIGLGLALFKGIHYLSVVSMEEERFISIGNRSVCLEVGGNARNERF